MPAKPAKVVTPKRPAPLLTAPPVPLVRQVPIPQPQATAGPQETPSAPPQTAASFPVDIYGHDHRIYLRAELPGVDHTTIQVQPLAGHLSIFASCKALAAGAPSPEPGFARLIALPGGEPSATLISTHYALGILTLVLSCTEDVEARPTAIPVN